MKSYIILMVTLSFLVFSCEKPENRKCWKSEGDATELSFGLDSINSFRFGKNIKYNIYESSEKKLVVRGGENMVQSIGLSYSGYELEISNQNKCHFLRSGDRYLEVDLYYPEFKKMYFEASDSVIFQDTLRSDTLLIQMHEGGGSMVLNVDTKYISVIVSEGTADYTLGGKSIRSEIKVQNKGYADASGFTANSMFVYQYSTADLKINMEGCSVNSIIDGSGDLYVTGNPTNFLLGGVGSGKLIEY